MKINDVWMLNENRDISMIDQMVSEYRNTLTYMVGMSHELNSDGLAELGYSGDEASDKALVAQKSKMVIIRNDFSIADQDDDFTLVAMNGGHQSDVSYSKHPVYKHLLVSNVNSIVKKTYDVDADIHLTNALNYLRSELMDVLGDVLATDKTKTFDEDYVNKIASMISRNIKSISPHNLRILGVNNLQLAIRRSLGDSTATFTSTGSPRIDQQGEKIYNTISGPIDPNIDRVKESHPDQWKKILKKSLKLISDQWKAQSN